jgi:hypothetical protein
VEEHSAASSCPNRGRNGGPVHDSRVEDREKGENPTAWAQPVEEGGPGSWQRRGYGRCRAGNGSPAQDGSGGAWVGPGRKEKWAQPKSTVPISIYSKFFN